MLPSCVPCADFKATEAQAERQAALAKWDQIVRLMPRLFDPTVLSQLHHEDFSVELGNLDLIFSKKSTSTLLCRASSMLRFCSWFIRSFPEEAVSEPVLFLYFQKLRKDKKDTSGPDQLLQALNFCSGTLSQCRSQTYAQPG